MSSPTPATTTTTGTSTDKKIIAIVGATGNQGISVVHTFLSLGSWHVRVLTRSPSSSTAQELSSLGAEIVAIDLNDPSTLVPAFHCAHSIFVNTDFLNLFMSALGSGLDVTSSLEQAYEVERQQGINAIEAASNVPTLQRFTYSALSSTRKASGGKYSKAYHWESKASVVDYIFETPRHLEKRGLASKTSIIYCGGYIDSPLLRPKFDAGTNSYLAFLPAVGPREKVENTPMVVIDQRTSIGKYVRCLIEDEEPNTRLLAYDISSPVKEYFDIWSRLTKKSYEVKLVTLEELQAATGYPLELIEPYAFVFEFSYSAGMGNIIFPNQLKNKPIVEDYEDYLKSQTEEFLLGESK